MNQLKQKKTRRKLPPRKIVDADFVTSSPSSRVMDDLLLPSHHDRVILSQLWEENETHRSELPHVVIDFNKKKRLVSNTISEKTYLQRIKETNKDTTDLSTQSIIPITLIQNMNSKIENDEACLSPSSEHSFIENQDIFETSNFLESISLEEKTSNKENIDNFMDRRESPVVTEITNKETESMQEPKIMCKDSIETTKEDTVASENIVEQETIVESELIMEQEAIVESENISDIKEINSSHAEEPMQDISTTENPTIELDPETTNEDYNDSGDLSTIEETKQVDTLTEESIHSTKSLEEDNSINALEPETTDKDREGSKDVTTLELGDSVMMNSPTDKLSEDNSVTGLEVEIVDKDHVDFKDIAIAEEAEVDTNLIEDNSNDELESETAYDVSNIKEKNKQVESEEEESEESNTESEYNPSSEEDALSIIEKTSRTQELNQNILEEEAMELEVGTDDVVQIKQESINEVVNDDKEIMISEITQNEQDVKIEYSTVQVEQIESDDLNKTEVSDLQGMEEDKIESNHQEITDIQDTYTINKFNSILLETEDIIDSIKVVKAEMDIPKLRVKQSGEYQECYVLIGRYSSPPIQSPSTSSNDEWMTLDDNLEEENEEEIGYKNIFDVMSIPKKMIQSKPIMTKPSDIKRKFKNNDWIVNNINFSISSCQSNYINKRRKILKSKFNRPLIIKKKIKSVWIEEDTEKRCSYQYKR